MRKGILRTFPSLAALLVSGGLANAQAPAPMAPTPKMPSWGFALTGYETPEEPAVPSTAALAQAPDDAAQVKADAPKADAPKADAPKADPPKADALKPAAASCATCDSAAHVDCCAEEKHLWNFQAGAGVQVVQPNFHNNPAFTTLPGVTGIVVGGTPTINLIQQDFRYSLDVAPVAWIGFSSESGIGAQVRWWQYDQRANESATDNGTSLILSAGPILGVGAEVVPGSGDRLDTSSRLRFSVWDFDSTYRFTFGQWWVLLTAGVRYAHFSQDFEADTVNVIATGNSTAPQTLIASHSFNGAGPGIGTEGHRQIGTSGFSLYGKARATLLFGTTKEHLDWQNVLGLSTIIGGGFPGINLHAQTSEADTIPTASIELGAEYARSFGRAQAFVQVGGVAEEWFGAGNAVNVDGLVIRSGARSDLGFIGFSVQAGVRY